MFQKENFISFIGIIIGCTLISCNQCLTSKEYRDINNELKDAAKQIALTNKILLIVPRKDRHNVLKQILMDFKHESYETLERAMIPTNIHDIKNPVEEILKRKKSEELLRSSLETYIKNVHPKSYTTVTECEILEDIDYHVTYSNRLRILYPIARILIYRSTHNSDEYAKVNFCANNDIGDYKCRLMGILNYLTEPNIGYQTGGCTERNNCVFVYQGDVQPKRTFWFENYSVTVMRKENDEKQIKFADSITWYAKTEFPDCKAWHENTDFMQVSNKINSLEKDNLPWSLKITLNLSVDM